MPSDAVNAPPKLELYDIWKRSEVPSADAVAKVAINRTVLGERLSSSRSTLWTNFSQLAPNDQAQFFAKLSTIWPYKWEARATTLPLHASILANCITSSLITTRISCDLVLYEEKCKLFDGIRRAPKSPLVFGIYSSGVAFYMLHMTHVAPLIFREDDPCSSCVLTRNIVIALTSGIVLPLMSIPYLSYYVMLHRDEANKYPRITKMQEFLALSFKGNKAARSMLPYLVLFQVTCASLCAYSQLWGRNRIFSSMDADPDLAKDVMLAAQTVDGPKEKLYKLLQRIPFFNTIMGEQEDPIK